MSDLQAVIPQSNELTIAGEIIKIEAAKVGKLPQILQVIQPIAHLITNVKQGEKLDLSGLFMLYASDALALTAILADKPRTWVDSLDVDEALILFTQLFEVNLDFFISRVLPLVADAMKKFANVVSQSQAKINGLATSCTLVSAGHRYDDILNYTLPQYFAFLKAIHKQKRTDLAMHLHCQIIAQHGDTDDIKALYKELSNDDA